MLNPDGSPDLRNRKVIQTHVVTSQTQTYFLGKSFEGRLKGRGEGVYPSLSVGRVGLRRGKCQRICRR